MHKRRKNFEDTDTPELRYMKTIISIYFQVFVIFLVTFEVSSLHIYFRQVLNYNVFSMSLLFTLLALCLAILGLAFLQNYFQQQIFSQGLAHLSNIDFFKTVNQVFFDFLPSVEEDNFITYETNRTIGGDSAEDKTDFFMIM